MARPENCGPAEWLEIYRRMGVPQMWFWVDGRTLERVITTVDEDAQTETVRADRRTVELR